MFERCSVKGKLKNRNLQRSILRGVIYFSSLMVGLLLIPAHAQAERQELTPSNPKRILVLYSYGYSLPSYRKFNSGFVSVMEKAGVKYGDLFFEYLDLPQMRDTERKQALADILRHKYAEISLDLIITIHAPATLFLQNEAKDIFPHVPTISWIMQERFKQDYAGNGHLQIFAGLDVQGTLKRALELFPETRRVLFVSGTFQIDAETEREARSIFSHWESELQFEYTSHLSVEETLERVANLPPQSIVIYWNVIRDKTGRIFNQTDVGRMVAMSANAPVFCLFDTLLGFGMVGGSLQSYELGGTRIGNLALDVLNGRINLTEQNEQLVLNSVPMFDWKQLERWGADPSKLPKGSIFVNRPQSIWDQYRWYVVSSLIILMVQSSLIVGLLIHRSHRKSAEKSLRRAEHKYRNIFEGALEGIYETSPEGKNLTSNTALAKMLGYDSPEEVTSAITDSAHQVWVDPNQRLDYIRQLEHNGVVLNCECQYYRKDKTKIWVSLNSKRVAGPDGKTLHYSGFIEDVTERKQAEDALKQSEERYRALVETSSDWVWEVDANAKYTYADPKVQKILGYTPEEVIGRTPFELMSEEESHRVGAIFAEVAADRRPFFGLINVNLHRDGREVVLETSGVPICGPNGVFLGYRGMDRDVTERILAEKALRESEERFRFMMEATGDVLYRLRYDTMNYDYLSPGIGKLTGYSPEEIKTIGFSSLVTRIDLLGQEDVPAKVIFEDRLAGKTGEYRADYLITTKTGTSKWLRDHSFPWYDDSGKNIGSVGILSDSTDYKQAEEILRERTAELNVSNKALMEYAAKLESLNEELEDFAFVAAHDLQEPLRKICTYCDMAQNRYASTLDGAGQEYLDRVISSASRMRQLLSDLLQFSLVVTRSEPFKVIDLDRIVREAADLFEEDLKKSGGLIEIGAMPAVEADEIQILRLFQNLIGNALKFRSAEPPKIVIHAEQAGSGICEIFVKDNGLGFEHQFAERIFKPFQRLHKRNKYEGTGIGLTICRKIAERHGGSIRVESELGKGSTFIIRLPVKQDRREGI